MESEGDNKPERFSSGGVTVGVFGIVAVVAVLVVGSLDEQGGFPAWGYPCGVLVAAVIWAVMMRPALVLTEDEVELRNVFHSRWVPYGRIDSVAVDQMTNVVCDDKKYVASGFGRTRRAISRDEVRGAEGRSAEYSLGRLVEDKIRRRMATAKDLARELGPVRRTWAWPEIVVVTGAAITTLVTAAITG